VLPTAALLVVVTAVAFLSTARARPNRLARVARRRRLPWAMVGVWLTAAVLLGLLSRPWWLVSHFVSDPSYVNAIAGRQRAEGLPVDGTRSYDEYTVNWLAWYFGWVAVVIAGIGVLLVVRRLIVRRDARLALLLAVPALTALIYLNRVSITPDQIWAMRRLVPAVAPGMLLVAGYACREAARALTDRIRTGGARPRQVALARGLIAAAAVAVFTLPALTWGQLATSREGAGEQGLVAAGCSHAPGDRAVHAGDNPSFGHFVPALQQACGLQAVGVAKASSERMAAIAQQWGDPESILVVTFDSHSVPWQGGRPGTSLSIAYQRWEEKLMRRPQVPVDKSATVWIGLLQPDGTVRPINLT
jgi:hypothetical protein